jgi:F-type H+-transporting ATPase subunit delta
MIAAEVGKKYGQALFRALKKYQVEDAAEKDLLLFLKFFEEDPSFKNFLLSPKVRDKDKKSFLKITFKDKVSDILLNMLLLLIEKNRLSHLPEICSEFGILKKEDRGIIKAEVKTAISLDEDLARILKEKLERKVNKKIEMEKKVDPSIIGGIVVVVGGKVIDRSVRCQLNQIKEKVKQAKIK